MRRLALLLVPLFLFACDREPVAPEISPTLGVSATQTQVGPRTITFNLCGYDIVTATYEGHIVGREVVNDAGEMSHFIGSWQWHGWAVGQNTGLNWRWNEVQNIQSQWDEDGAPDTYFILNRNTHLIGLGDAPDFDIVIRIRYTVNANGIVVHDVDFRDDMCQD